MSMGTTATSGNCTPAPAACKTRPTMSTGNDGATAQSAVPTMNASMDAKKSLRVGNRSIRNPLMGTMIPFTSR